MNECPLCITPCPSPEGGTLPVEAFSSRGGYEGRAHFQYCGTHALYFVSETPSLTTLHNSYVEAPFESARESEFAARDYHRALKPYLNRFRPQSVLDVGAGDGAFLKLLALEDIPRRRGLELNRAARNWAKSHRDIELESESFEELQSSEKFDLVTFFHVLSHLPHPRAALVKARELLTSGALLCVVDHDPEGGTQRLLGAKSPIFDPTHFSLWTRDSLIRLVSEEGFEVLETRSFTNTYPLAYWLKLLPWGRRLLPSLETSRWGRGMADLPLRMRAGNRIWICQKL